jgi:hypothetical protein
MRLSISRSRESVWVWLFWGLGIYLTLELGSFLIAALLLRKTATELAGPYLALAVPWMVFAPMIWWLRKWEEQRASPMRLARLWGLAMAFFGGAITAAVVYSGVVLSFITPTDALIISLLIVLFSVPILYFVMYHQALRLISARAAMRQGDYRPK